MKKQKKKNNIFIRFAFWGYYEFFNIVLSFFVNNLDCVVVNAGLLAILQNRTYFKFSELFDFSIFEILICSISRIVNLITIPFTFGSNSFMETNQKIIKLYKFCKDMKCWKFNDYGEHITVQHPIILLFFEIIFYRVFVYKNIPFFPFQNNKLLLRSILNIGHLLILDSLFDFFGLNELRLVIEIMLVIFEYLESRIITGTSDLSRKERKTPIMNIVRIIIDASMYFQFYKGKIFSPIIFAYGLRKVFLQNFELSNNNNNIITTLSCAFEFIIECFIPISFKCGEILKTLFIILHSIYVAIRRKYSKPLTLVLFIFLTAFVLCLMRNMEVTWMSLVIFLIFLSNYLIRKLLLPSVKEKEKEEKKKNVVIPIILEYSTYLMVFLSFTVWLPPIIQVNFDSINSNSNKYYNIKLSDEGHLIQISSNNTDSDILISKFNLDPNNETLDPFTCNLISLYRVEMFEHQYSEKFLNHFKNLSVISIKVFFNEMSFVFQINYNFYKEKKYFFFAYDLYDQKLQFNSTLEKVAIKDSKKKNQVIEIMQMYILNELNKILIK